MSTRGGYRRYRGRSPIRGGRFRSRRTYQTKGVNRWYSECNRNTISVGSGQAKRVRFIQSSSSEAIEIRHLRLVMAVDTDITSGKHVSAYHGLLKTSAIEAPTDAQLAAEAFPRWFMTQPVIYTHATQPVIERTLPGRLQISQDQDLSICCWLENTDLTGNITFEYLYAYRYRVTNRPDTFQNRGLHDDEDMQSQGLLSASEPEFEAWDPDSEGYF